MTIDPSALSPLGKASEYRCHYAPELLFPIPRQLKRDEIGIDPARLPFVGEDLWNAYEISWLNPRGKPVVALGTFRIPAQTPHLIESKSFKLYLNSFNQSPFADAETVAATLARDLSAAAGGQVTVQLEPLAGQPRPRVDYPSGILLDELDIECDRYQPAPELLTAAFDEQPVEETLASRLLKSNCPVTGQPDWGSVQIRYAGPQIDQAALLRYIISFRNHDEFHEHCVERMFSDLWARCRPSKLSVYARYTRRGGLDINPWRTSHPGQPPSPVRTARQ